ncbi:MAG: hypothetical protein ABH879_02435 [archaeon]
MKPRDLADFEYDYDPDQREIKMKATEKISNKVLLSEDEQKLRYLQLAWRRKWIDYDRVLSVINKIRIEFPKPTEVVSLTRMEKFLSWF